MRQYKNRRYTKLLTKTTISSFVKLPKNVEKEIHFIWIETLSDHIYNDLEENRHDFSRLYSSCIPK